MKVCHISSAHAPNDTRIFHKQCASLARAGYDTTFVVKAKDPQSVGETTEKGVRVIQVPVDTSSRLKRMLFGAKAVYQKALEVDADIAIVPVHSCLPTSCSSLISCSSMPLF